MTQVQAERETAVPAGVVYTCLSDYARHHRNILPSAFTSYVVEAGGVGAGTVLRTATRLGGVRRELLMDVTEPEPGRVLVERDRLSSMETTFTVTPTGPVSCRVMIGTVWDAPARLRGWVEKRLAPGVMRRLYEEELALLAAYAVGQVAVG